jgi:hypothetical protein
MMMLMSPDIQSEKRVMIPMTRLMIVMMTPTVHTQPHALKQPIPRRISMIPMMIRTKPRPVLSLLQ